MTEVRQSHEGTKQEIVVPKETARALGAGLNHLFKEPLGQISPCIENLKASPGSHQVYLQDIEASIPEIIKIVNNLEQARETRIVPFAGHWDFKFSEERETGKQRPIQHEIIIDDTTTPTLEQLTVAIQHNFNNKLALLMACAEQIQRSTQNPTTTQNAKEIHSRSESIFNAINLIENADNQLRISTDSNGTTITPVQPALVKQTI
jgi:two-component sensor histidine kinase